MSREETDRLEQQIRQALDQQSAALDTATLERLRRSRVRALKQQPRRNAKGGWLTLNLPRFTLPATVAGALASIMLVGFGLLFWLQNSEQGPQPLSKELESLVTGNSLELYQQLDFLLWLKKERDGAEADPQGRT